ncbi:MAG: alpha/beta fold hydrolase [Planctomycetales bacterium]|nr:alpha/beta fold hydrolase [Planctomycetales bacterium]
MKVELVRTRTADGMWLDGALSFAEANCSGQSHIAAPNAAVFPDFDAVILLHGVGSNFYQPRLLRDLAEAFDNAGVWTLRANTRGHDTLHTAATDQGGRIQGAAVEQVHDCLHDLDAWLAFLADRGRQRVLLLGHSLGAIKAVYYAAQRAVAALAAISPPRLSAAAFGESRQSRVCLDSLELARRQITAGQGQTLIEVRFPFPMQMSPETYVDKYGGERYNILDRVGELRCPTLFTYGELELAEGPFAGLPERLLEQGDRQCVSVEVVAGANHSYADRSEALFERIRARFAG